MGKRQVWTLLLLCCACFVTASADVIVLRNGTRLEGWVECRPEAERLTLKRADGTQTIPRSEVRAVELQGTAPPPATVAPEEDADVVKLLDAFAALPEAPEAGAYYLEDGSDWVLNSDGSYTVTTVFTAKILQDRKKHLAFASFSYDKQRKSIRVDRARTITPDGRVIPLDPAAITDRVTFQGSKSYSCYKTLSFTLPEVTVGCIVDWQVTETVHKPLFEGYFTPRCFFGNEEPTHRIWLRVSLPSDRTLHFAFRPVDGVEIKPEISESTGRRVYLWSMMNLPPLIEEEKRPPFSEIVPSVACSLFADWGPIFDWNGGKIAAHIADSSPEIEATARELTAGAADEDERIARVYYWIQQNIRYVSVKGDVVAGLAGHPARETFEKKYGDCVDKAILMSAMLRCLGTDCHPTGAMTNSGGDWLTDVPQYFVNHSFVYICKADSTEVWLDPTTTNYRYPYFREDDHGVRAMIPTLRRFQDTPVPLHVERRQRMTMEITLDGDFLVDARQDLTAGTEAAYRGFLKARKPEERQDALARMLNASFPGLRVREPFRFPDVDDLHQPFYLESRYSIEHYAMRAGDLMIFQFPGIERSFSELALDSRRFDIEYHTLTGSETHCEVILPPGWRLDYLPSPLSLNSLNFQVDARYEPTENGFRYREEYRRKRHRIVRSDYAAFKAEALQIQDFTRRRIILRQEKGATE